jgi:Protein of unknown function (DUF2490)
VAVAPNEDSDTGVCAERSIPRKTRGAAETRGSDNMKAVLFLVALAVAAPAAAQTATQPRVWMEVSVQGRVGSDSPWRWAADSLVRTRNGASTVDFMGEWFSVKRDLTQRSAVGIGYAFVAGFPDDGLSREHRFVQQYTWRADLAGRVSVRTQLEERFVSGGNGMAVRVRERFRSTWPLEPRETLRAAVWDEVFVKVNSPARTTRGFDSNQLFVGIGHKVTGRSSVDIGYLNVYSPGAPSRARYSHVMAATLVMSLSEVSK